MIPHVQLTRSAIDRQGVTATAQFHQGDRILPIDDSRAVTPSHPLDEAKGEFPHHCDYLAQGRVVLMQPPERFINHSCDPNTYVKTIAGVRWVIARRSIAPGEEITYDYSINSSGDTVWTCHCGSPRCRRQVHSDFFHLPPDLQREYLPLLDDWYCEEHVTMEGMRLRRTIVYVKHLPLMEAFYGTALGLKRVEETRSDGWVEFEAGGITLALHAIPPHIAGAIEIATPPQPREETPIKLFFESDDAAGLCQRLESQGITVTRRPWGTWDATDPEGNVFAIAQAS